ncbi:hypothetical protein [Streptomyces silvensis]|uniref:hypothetical protein n=1 Tax=Streptomyces silvensis TaxID=1765722 RepID=UPI000738AD31|nr:hypothetical protein [Streptomyces silvensis]
MANLITNVHVTDAAGQAHVFGPADDVPAWAVELITNPKAWDEAPVKREPVDATPKPAKRATPRRKAGLNGPVQPD